MRIVLGVVLSVLLCFAGYVLAFQHSGGERPPSSAPKGGYTFQHSRQPAIRPEPLPAEGQVSYTVPGPGPVLFEEPVAQPSQMSVVISKSGLRFLSPRA